MYILPIGYSPIGYSPIATWRLLVSIPHFLFYDEEIYVKPTLPGFSAVESTAGITTSCTVRTQYRR